MAKVKSEIEAYIMKRVTRNLKPINWSINAKKHLKAIPFPNLGPKRIVDILIGVVANAIEFCEMIYD